MARIIAPNKEYAGVSAGISFSGGEGHTDNEYLIGWFRSHGYEVIEDPAEIPETEGPETETVETEVAETETAETESHEHSVQEGEAAAGLRRRKREGR